MAVALVASKLGFDFEQIEDLRLGVDELTMRVPVARLRDQVEA